MNFIHRIDARAAARDIDIVGSSLLQRQPDELAATLDFRPIVELVAHQDLRLAGRRRAYRFVYGCRKVRGGAVHPAVIDNAPSLTFGANELGFDFGSMTLLHPATAAWRSIARQQQQKPVGDIVGRIDDDPRALAGQFKQPTRPHRKAAVDPNPRLRAHLSRKYSPGTLAHCDRPPAVQPSLRRSTRQSLQEARRTRRIPKPCIMIWLTLDMAAVLQPCYAIGSCRTKSNAS
jgi:hypothetical protein